jgi:thioredoxin-related protein
MKTKNIILALIIGLIVQVNIFAQSKQINWMTWSQAIEQQKKDLEKFNSSNEPNKTPPKKIFLDVYTDWCGWCKKMDQSTFIDPVIVDIMNQYYYPVKFDAEMKDTIIFNGHTFINPNPSGNRSTHQLAASILDYQLSYPSYVILDENTSRLTIYKGFKQIDDFLGILLFFGKNQHVSYTQQLETQYKQQYQNK